MLAVIFNFDIKFYVRYRSEEISPSKAFVILENLELFYGRPLILIMTRVGNKIGINGMSKVFTCASGRAPAEGWKSERSRGGGVAASPRKPAAAAP